MMTRKEVAETCVRVATHTAMRLIHTKDSPLESVLIVPVWLSELGYESAPVLLGDRDSFPWLCKTLRELADRVEAGEFTVITNAKGGDG